jgi:predicted enzyme related to lactoylglutathione lyase
MLNGLQFVLIHVPSIAAVRAFYTETLGFQVADQQPGFIQFAQPSGATFAISEDGAGEPHSSTELWWFVDDADAVHAALHERGAQVAQAPTDMPFGRTFAVTDPAGNTLYMLQPRG